MNYRYAQNTSVDVDRSRLQIEGVLRKHGARDLGVLHSDRDGEVLIAFKLNSRLIRIGLPMVDRSDPRIAKTPKGRVRRNVDQVYKQESRRRWRALLLIVKAKLEAVEAGVSTFEDEFLAFTVLPGGSTVGEELQPKLTTLFTKGGHVPELLPHFPSPAERDR